MWSWVSALKTPRTFVLCLCLLFVYFIYSPALLGGFIFDDLPNITSNVKLYVKGVDHVSLWRAASSFPVDLGLRLIPMLTFGIDYFIADGFDPSVYKTTSLVMHLITFLVLVGFVRCLLVAMHWQKSMAFWWALFISLVWAVHPLHVSSVSYVVQRMQTLEALFMVLALWWYIKTRLLQIEGQASWKSALWVLCFWALALASKEDAVLLPFFLFDSRV